MRALGAAAIREAFEESGILLARDARHGDFVTRRTLEELQHYRALLDKREVALARRAAEGEAAAGAATSSCTSRTGSRRPTCPSASTRISSSRRRRSAMSAAMTAASPWIRSGSRRTRAISDRKKWNVIFPTKLNLMKLRQSKTVGEAIAAARATTPLPVTPWVENGPDGQILRIRDDAGYAQTSAQHARTRCRTRRCSRCGAASSASATRASSSSATQAPSRSVVRPLILSRKMMRMAATCASTRPSGTRVGLASSVEQSAQG